jgi:hypothetical protein
MQELSGGPPSPFTLTESRGDTLLTLRATRAGGETVEVDAWVSEQVSRNRGKGSGGREAEKGGLGGGWQEAGIGLRGGSPSSCPRVLAPAGAAAPAPPHDHPPRPFHLTTPAVPPPPHLQPEEEELFEGEDGAVDVDVAVAFTATVTKGDAALV